MIRSRKPLTEIKRIEKGWTRSTNDDSTGSGGELRVFHIDFGYYINCLLPRNKPFYVKKYYLEKGGQLNIDVNEPAYEESSILYIASFEKEKLSLFQSYCSTDYDPPEGIIPLIISFNYYTL